MSKQNFTIAQIIEHLTKLDAEIAMEEKNAVVESPLKKLLDENNIEYVQSGHIYGLALPNGKTLSVDALTGEHRFKSGGQTYTNTRLTTQGWTDFLCLKGLLPSEYASGSVQEAIDELAENAKLVTSHLDSQLIKYTIDPITKFVFLDNRVRRFKGRKIWINCQKCIISIDGKETVFNLGSFAKTFDSVIENLEFSNML